MKYLFVITTTPNYKTAKRICKLLLQKSLAGCCQIIGPIKSHYLWNNKIQSDKEYLCFIKTKEACYKRLEAIIKDNHPYQVPEIVALEIKYAFKKYLNWLNNCIKRH
ncbi:MAG: divalent-cation tolerance protein CutA [candidate division WOR-3 bacterium]|nr:divalent-cation tolerance protein CutA [candidate division WOR-3 bacterium]